MRAGMVAWGHRHWQAAECLFFLVCLLLVGGACVVNVASVLLLFYLPPLFHISSAFVLSDRNRGAAPLWVKPVRIGLVWKTMFSIPRQVRFFLPKDPVKIRPLETGMNVKAIVYNAIHLSSSAGSSFFFFFKFVCLLLFLSLWLWGSLLFFN